MRLVLVFAFTIGCGSTLGDAPGPDVTDSDGDSISDVDEGAGANIDTDGDGTPDYQDADSDGDGISDADEAGDSDPTTSPQDADFDGTPNFRDLDADNNGIADADETTDDLDGDGRGNFADLDDDGDTLTDESELEEMPATPPDTDGDMAPNYQDTDSDNDNILDIDERSSDPDQDTIPAYKDLDSDDDCIPDATEAGDDQPGTAPIDTDDDGRPNFLDLDSDNDGLADEAEDVNCSGAQDGSESDLLNPDSDGDGVTDLVEDVAGTDPLSGSDNPQANGDFFFLIPYEEPTTPTDDTLEFRTSIQFADLYFSFDTTGSMSGELSAMNNATTGVPAIISGLVCAPTGGTCSLDEDCALGVCFDGDCVEDPLAGDGCVPDLQTGVGIFDNLNSYTNLLSIQDDPAATAAAIPGTGCCGAEAPVQAAACVADPANCTNTPGCAASGVGCPGFRAEAVRILVQITDADDQCTGGPNCTVSGITFTTAYAGQELIAEDIKFIGLFGSDDDRGTVPGTPEDLARAIGIAAGSVDTLGEPFVYEAVDSGVVDSTTEAVLDIVRGLPLDVPIGAEDVSGDDGDSLQFIDYLEVNVSGTGNCTTVASTDDRDSDGRDDAFPELLPGTPVCWDVVPIATNTLVEPTTEPQLFVARLTVYGDGSPLDTRDVFFLLPPVIDTVPID